MASGVGALAYAMSPTVRLIVLSTSTAPPPALIKACIAMLGLGKIEPEAFGISSTSGALSMPLALPPIANCCTFAQRLFFPIKSTYFAVLTLNLERGERINSFSSLGCCMTNVSISPVLGFISCFVILILRSFSCSATSTPWAFFFVAIVSIAAQLSFDLGALSRKDLATV